MTARLATVRGAPDVVRLLNPWALLGLVAVAAPVVAHLLARRPARRQPFPTLRFLPASTPRPVSRERLTDLALLALRCLIVAGAAFALAQPLWVSDARARDLGRQIARAIIVDTSASMRRGVAVAPGAAAAGVASAGVAGASATAVDRARERAKTLAAEATVARVVETDTPSTLVAGARAWLAAQPMRRELVIVSDFQIGTIARSDLIDVPADTGVRLEAVAADRGAAPGPGTPEPPGLSGGAGLILLAGDSERPALEAARAAAVGSGAPEAPGAPAAPAPPEATSRIALLFPSAPARADILRGARPLSSADSFTAFERIIRDPLVVEAFQREGLRATDVLSAVEASVDGQATKVIVFGAKPGPLTAAAVIRASAAAASPSWIAERERTAEAMPAAERLALERQTPESALGQPANDSHGRWIWLGVLALLLIELAVRRTRRSRPIEEVPDARVA